MRVHLKDQYGELDVEGERYEVASVLEVFSNRVLGVQLEAHQVEALRYGLRVGDCIKTEVKPRKRKSRKR